MQAAALSERSRRNPSLVVAGVPLDNLTRTQAIDEILNLCEQGIPSQVCFVNAHCVNVAQRDPMYLGVLRTARLCLADGLGIRIAGRLLGTPVLDNVNGTDLFEPLCRAVGRHGGSLFLLGGHLGVAEQVRDWLLTRDTGITVLGTEHGFFSHDEDRVVAKIAASHADVLLVAMGVPLQDVWISKRLPELGVKVALGVGGLFDFYSGRIPRAPFWMRSVGAEWVYRLYQEPYRLWRRYLLGNPAFLWRVAAGMVEERGWRAFRSRTHHRHY